ncbi:MAG TPA: Ig-like domain-containing protein, partial [Candidatus Limnocylindrales bacterium]|nr:Ig-like domain-containing protein [Candidatus Limnocylindrales bacterium]
MQGLLVASRLRDLRRFRFAAAGAAVVLVAVLAAQAIQPPGAPTGSPPSGSSPSTSSGTASQGPTGTQPAAQWQPLDLLPYSPVADLTADRSSASGVAGDTTFTLRSHTSASAVDLARGLVSSPSVDLHVAPGATADVATLSATTRLTDGARYRFRLNGLDGALIGSWSFRVAGPLHVTGLLPDDRTVGVPTTTGIEVTFDQDGVTGFDTHFTITPAVAGRFEQHERTWVFVPLTSLAPGTLYTYTVRAGVQQAGSTETLEQAVTASFETVTSQPTETSLAFDRALFDVRTGARPLLGLWVGLVEGTPAPTSLPIRLYRLPTIDAAAAAAAKLNTQDDWLLGSEAGLVDTAGLTQVGSFAASLTDPANGNFVMHVPAVLDPGWYLLVVPRNG